MVDSTLIPIETLNMPYRAFSALKRAGYSNVQQLQAAPDNELLRVRNLGRKSLEDIRAAVADWQDNPQKGETILGARNTIAGYSVIGAVSVDNITVVIAVSEDIQDEYSTWECIANSGKYKHPHFKNGEQAAVKDFVDRIQRLLERSAKWNKE